MNRRKFLHSSAACCVMLQSGNTFANTQSINHEASSPEILSLPDIYMAAAKGATGLFSVESFNTKGDILQSFDLPRRGHSFASNQNGILLAIGRRPADYFLVIHSSLDYQAIQINAPKNRRYYGHAAFNVTGDIAYLTENDLDSGQGVIGMYEVKNNFKRIGEFSSHGIGPHDVRFDMQRQCLIVANGGVKTHPNTGRKKLNIETMKSSLVFLDPINGSLIDEMVLDESSRFNSIRHIALDAKSNVYLSLQNQRIDSQQTLLAIYRQQTNTLEACAIPADLEPGLNRYLGDITLDQSEEIFATTSPRGNTVLIYAASGTFLNSYQLDDVCGVSRTSNPYEFMVTSGSGEVLLLSVEKDPELNVKEFSKFVINVKPIADFAGKLAWDNHLFLS